MGNKLIRHRVVIDERYTRPQGLYESKEGDYRKLRRLILNRQLAPCFPGAEESTFDLEECPICFLFYPSLNRSKCCSKGICTECYLQMKASYAGRLARCPFCKTPGYMVEYRGAKTVEEKDFEQAEEQKVIEAKIRIRQKELHEENHMQSQDQGQSESVSTSEPGDYFTDASGLGTQQDKIGQPGEPSASGLTSEEGRLLSPALIASMQEFYQQTNRNEDFDLDMDDIMLMEAIWLSIQEQGGAPGGPDSLVGEDHNWVADFVAARERSSAPVGFAGAIAALAERQVIGAENRVRPMESTTRFDSGSHNSTDLNNNFWVDDVSRESSHLLRRGSRSSNSDYLFDHSSEAVEVGTSFSSSLPDVPWEEAPPDILLPQNIEEQSLSSLMSGQEIPESFEEQITLVMALSLAEARAEQARR